MSIRLGINITASNKSLINIFWVLISGVWRDNGTWKDDATWIDGV
jgi:hypothetical protein